MMPMVIGRMPPGCESSSCVATGSGRERRSSEDLCHDAPEGAVVGAGRHDGGGALMQRLAQPDALDLIGEDHDRGRRGGASHLSEACECASRPAHVVYEHHVRWAAANQRLHVPASVDMPHDLDAIDLED